MVIECLQIVHVIVQLGLLIYVLIMAGEGVSGYVFKPVYQWDAQDVSDWVSSIAPFARDTVSELVLEEVGLRLLCKCSTVNCRALLELIC